MEKFEFRLNKPAKPAKPAKDSINKGFPVAKDLLKTAKVAGGNGKRSATLADLSNGLAGQDTFKIDSLSNISRISSVAGAKRSVLPPPEPPGLGPKYTRLWNQAWQLADFIDDSDGAPIEQRRALLPELNKLRDRLAEIENTGGLVPDDPPPPVKPKDTGTWTKWAPAAGRNDVAPDTCPAQCRRTGKCYARAYFEGKPGKAAECMPDICKWRLDS